MSQAQKNKEVALQILDRVIGEADLDLADQLIAPDYRNHRTGLQGAVEALKIQRSVGGSDVSSLEGFKRGLKLIRRSFPDWHHTVQELVAEGDLVIGTWRLTATFTGEPFLGFEANGQPVSKDEAGVMRFRDGKLVEFWGLSDTLPFLLQLGARLLLPDGSQRGAQCTMHGP
jgi:predicted ester cyclase